MNHSMTKIILSVNICFSLCFLLFLKHFFPRGSFLYAPYKALNRISKML